jgi:pectate lyase
VQVPAGTYYLWARIAGPTPSSDALYVGIDSSFARVFPTSAPSGSYEWVKVAISEGFTTFGFALTAGAHVIQVGHGEIGARLDGVYLTADANEVPTLAPVRRMIEAETMTLTPPMTVGNDAEANGAQYISPTSGTSTTVPVREASTTLNVSSAGTYYLWARLKGPTIDSDALYVGFDNTFIRVFPLAMGVYEWVRVEATPGSVNGFTLSAGAHIIQVGHGEIGARLDALYVTDNASDTPSGSSTPPAPPPAPGGNCALPSGGYEGFGRNTTGGAGQPVVHVKNLNDDGDDSLRAALSAGNRCIVFDVGGEINLSRELIARWSNVTIDGFTAPSPGITLVNKKVPADPTRSSQEPGVLSVYGGDYEDPTRSDASNVIVRGLRIRHSPGDGISVYNVSQVVIDHVSVSGYWDGGIDITKNSHDVTVQWSIIGGNNGEGSPSLISINARRVSVHHNLYTMGEYRQPMCSAGSEASAFPLDIVCDVRNNLVWNFAGHGTAVMRYGIANIINNYYFSTTTRRASDGHVGDESNVIHIGFGGFPTDVYVDGNRAPRNGWNLDSPRRGNRTTPFPVAAPATTDAITAARTVRENAGARNIPNWGLDETDQGYINQIPEQP